MITPPLPFASGLVSQVVLAISSVGILFSTNCPNCSLVKAEPRATVTGVVIFLAPAPLASIVNGLVVTTPFFEPKMFFAASLLVKSTVTLAVISLPAAVAVSTLVFGVVVQLTVDGSIVIGVAVVEILPSVNS